jgi:hypothetical protein
LVGTRKAYQEGSKFCSTSRRVTTTRILLGICIRITGGLNIILHIVLGTQTISHSSRVGGSKIVRDLDVTTGLQHREPQNAQPRARYSKPTFQLPFVYPGNIAPIVSAGVVFAISSPRPIAGCGDHKKRNTYKGT